MKMMINDNIKKLEKVLVHIQNVHRIAQKLGIILIKNDEHELGRNLIANAQLHDNSKLKGIEFEHLFAEDNLLEVTIVHHRIQIRIILNIGVEFIICRRFMLPKWFVILLQDQLNLEQT